MRTDVKTFSNGDSLVAKEKVFTSESINKKREKSRSRNGAGV